MKNSKTVLAVMASLLIVLAAGGYVLFSAQRAQSDIADRNVEAQARLDDFLQTQSSSSQTSDEIPPRLLYAEGESILAAGDVVYIHRVPGEDYGRLAIKRSTGQIEMLDRRCVRSHVAGAVGICLDGPDALGVYSSTIIDFSNNELKPLREDRTALPSRARVSEDELWVSSTAFTSGTSYDDVSGFSTAATIFDMLDLGWPSRLAQHEIESTDGRDVGASPTFWGVTFGDDGEFWATADFDGAVELVKGNARDRVITPMGIDGSCPSLSPDRKHLAFKRPVTDDEGNFIGYRLVVRNLETEEQWDTGETGAVDDQVEWLDDDTLLYGVHVGNPNLPQPEFDLWSVDIAPDAEPALYLPSSNSPAVIR